MLAIQTMIDEMFPPHARGWTAFQNFPATDSIVSPARAGMDPTRMSIRRG